ncbi:MAG: Rne/Rng family ribonuclease [Flavobacteriales bacterium]|nr:Rne/Rng family ribonuclease [Flavobacteriales bacterium]MCB9449192.1 Rne/Rng family ribonuclease [Flavobacteriales bacterium]
MSSELIIKATDSEVKIAFLKDKQLIEFHDEKRNKNYVAGDLYLGRVTKIMPGLNAAFVDVGYEKDAFLHYHDLGPQFKSLSKYLLSNLNKTRKDGDLKGFKLEKDIDKNGKIGDVLAEKHRVLVQITKEPISTKGPRLSSEISLAGRYMVLVPFYNKVSVSQKINDEKERERLLRLIESIKPENFGVIVRTAARNRKVVDLDNDIKDLMAKWENCRKGIYGAQAPKKVLGEIDRTSALLRDVLNPTFNNIYTDSPELFEDIKKYLRSIGSDKESIVKLYQGKKSLFENFGIHRQIKSLFGKTVTMPSGAYLIIEHTEALHVVDINSGSRNKSDKDQETNALEVNMEAAREVARQLRLRDMGGIIVIDFIDMYKAENKKKLYDFMKDEMKLDRAKHKILPLSRFGLMQITRQRVRPEMNIVTNEKCPSCNGTGEIQPSILVADEVESKLRYISTDLKIKSVTLYTHPYLESFINRGLFSSLRKKWASKLGIKLKVLPSSSYQMLEYRFFDPQGEEIEMK